MHGQSNIDGGEINDVGKDTRRGDPRARAMHVEDISSEVNALWEACRP